ncbi:hypothetical protein GCM10023084_02990 [Streptomyces lacrimifluminis]
MDDLVRWLGEQVAEDERIAWDACGPDNLWKVAEQASCECCSNVRTAQDVLVCTPDDRDAPHIAEWSPARVLREIEAKRKALDHYAELQRLAKGAWPSTAPPPEPSGCRFRSWRWLTRTGPATKRRGAPSIWTSPERSRDPGRTTPRVSAVNKVVQRVREASQPDRGRRTIVRPPSDMTEAPPLLAGLQAVRALMAGS